MPCKDIVDSDPGGDNGETPGSTPSLFVANEDAEETVGAGRQVNFTVYASPATQTAPITFSYNTANDTAIAGTHYNAVSGTGTIQVDDASTTISVTVREPSSALGTTKQFHFNILSPVNAILGDSLAIGTIAYPTGGDGGGTPDWQKNIYTSISVANVPVYDQMRVYNNVSGPDHNDPDCKTADTAGCSGYSAALMMSILEHKVRHHSRVGFQARRILTDAGYTLGDPNGWVDTIVFRQLINGVGGHAAGALSCDGVRRRIQKMVEIPESRSGTTPDRWHDLRDKIKRRIVRNYCVYISSSFYHGLWDSIEVHNKGYLQQPDSWATGRGHSWILVGWNDHVTVKGRFIGGAFYVQSSHGAYWGNHGRAWLPYSILVNTYQGGGAPRRRDSHMGDPWFRFFYPVW